MQNTQYKLSRLAQAHLLNIKTYTVDNFSLCLPKRTK